VNSIHDVLVSIDERLRQKVAPDWLVGVARVALETERVGACQLSIVMTDDEQIQALNRDFAGDDYATDVLAFSLTEGEEFARPDEIERIGEVVISMETAARQADDAGIGTDQEIAHLVVHGVLHLLGYDHLAAQDEAAMRGREQKILELVGLSAH
jgi:probable rRNA maturation factor